MTGLKHAECTSDKVSRLVENRLIDPSTEQIEK